MNKLNIVIPTLNSETTLASTIDSLINKGKIFVIDGGSSDKTITIAKNFNVSFTITSPNRGHQLSTGAKLISDGWILFIHSDTVLDSDWHMKTLEFINSPGSKNRIGYFTFKFDDNNFFSRLIEFGVKLRCKYFSLPYGDQGLLIHSEFYKTVGGFAPIPLMEDVDLISRVSKKNLYNIDSVAITSSYKYKKKGYILRAIKNIVCLFMFKIGFPVKVIKYIYDL